MANKKKTSSIGSNIIGFRPTKRQEFEIQNISNYLGMTKSKLIRIVLTEFIDRFYDTLEKGKNERTKHP